ncbi:hypothetical protein V6Z11_D13G097200 [Gossypium hirsutum]
MFGSCCSPSLKPSLTLFFENSARCGVMVVKFGCMQSAAKFPAIKFFISPIKSYLLLQANLSATGDEAWRDKEAAVLALGVTARGCINGLYPRLSEIVASLIPLLDHKFTLIRSTSCWTLS